MCENVTVSCHLFSIQDTWASTARGLARGRQVSESGFRTTLLYGANDITNSPGNGRFCAAPLTSILTRRHTATATDIASYVTSAASGTRRTHVRTHIFDNGQEIPTWWSPEIQPPWMERSSCYSRTWYKASDCTRKQY